MRSRVAWAAAAAMALSAGALLFAGLHHPPPPAAAPRSPTPEPSASVQATFDGVPMACAKPESPPWTGGDLCLPYGSRWAAYDAARDVIWLTTRGQGRVSQDHDFEGVALTEFHPANGGSRTRIVETFGPKARRGVAAPVSVAENGTVWFAWGHTLARYDPATDTTKKWSLPPASFDPNPNASGTDGYPTALAAHGHDVWLAVDESQRLWHFDTTTGRWDSISLGPLVPVIRTTVEVLNDGRVAVGGVIRKSKTSYPGRLALVDPRRRKAELLPGNINQFVRRPDGSLVVATDGGVLQILDPSTGRLRATKVGAGMFNFNEKMTSDHLGNVWLTSRIDRRLVVVRADLDPPGRAGYPYPVESGTINPHGFGPRAVVFDPSIQAIVVDVRGDAWVFSYGGPGGGYPSVYRLRPT